MEGEERCIPISLQLHNGSHLELNVPTNTKISDLKATVCKQMGVFLRHCEIIYCGHVMKDDVNLGSYAIDASTTLHVVPKQTHDLTKFNLRTPPKIPFLTGIWRHRLLDRPCPLQAFQMTSQTDTLCKSWPTFHAFCKICRRIVPSKLRVRCDACQQNTVTVNRDPQGWDDVIKPDQILGYCRSTECEGHLCQAEFYFKCTVCSEESLIVPLPNVGSNYSKMICQTCLDIDDPVVKFPCYIDHVMCMSCFEQYARTNLRERTLTYHRTAGYTLQCPEGCENSYLADTHVFHLLGIDEYQVYQSYAAEECLLLNMKGIICPNPKCGAGLFPRNGSQIKPKVKVTCTSCQFEFCSTCKEEYHGSSNCSTSPPAQSTAGVVEDYFASIRMIEQISKKCPQCLTSTERSGGCMHMTCRVCHYEWCWYCVSGWTPGCQMDHWFG